MCLRQSFGIYRFQIMWLEMHSMVKSEEPSPFPALTQIEVYGREAENE